MERICKKCKEPLKHWHALLTVTSATDAGDYHRGCFNELTQQRVTGQWNVKIHNGEWAEVES